MHANVPCHVAGTRKLRLVLASPLLAGPLLVAGCAAPHGDDSTAQATAADLTETPSAGEAITFEEARRELHDLATVFQGRTGCAFRLLDETGSTVVTGTDDHNGGSVVVKLDPASQLSQVKPLPGASPAVSELTVPGEGKLTWIVLSSGARVLAVDEIRPAFQRHMACLVSE